MLISKLIFPARPNTFLHTLLFFLVLGSGWQAAKAQQTGPLLRINAGTLKEATGDGVTFIGDKYFSEPSSFGLEVGNPISGTTNDAIYQTERISNVALDPFEYAIPISGGTYSIVLHFAETTYQTSGQRVFDVKVEGLLVLDNYDIFAKAGSANKAVQENVINVNANDGFLNIEFISVVERAKISAIEIIGPVSPVSIPFALNAGGDAYSSASLNWMADDGKYFLNEGTPFTKAANIAGTQDDALYQSERFNTTIRFVLPGFERGLYTIELHFAETFHESAGQRIFDISLEGETVRDNYDIFTAAGGFSTAVVEVFPNVLIADGILNIRLTAQSVGISATINAIAVTSASSVANESESDLELPGSYNLTAAYPNPFNPQTQFSLSVAASQQVDIAVFNLLGQRVRTIYEGAMAARQTQEFSFDAASLPSGIYLIRVRGEHFLDTQQVILLK